MNTPDANQPESPRISDAQYQRLIGAYRFASGRELLLTRQGLGQDARYFYAEGDALVRLTPRSASQFASDLGETLSFDEEQQPACLLLHDAQGQRQAARRVALYEEEAITFRVNDDYTLAGSLLKPPGPGPHPAVVLYHLANCHERDYYRVYAQQFARQGIAALIYDKRGHGDSTGEPLSSQIYDLIEDGDAAFRFLQGHAQIEGRRVGVWGMSNGGWVDLGVAERHPEVAFVLNLSASGVPPSRQEQIRRVNVSRLLEASPEQLRFLNTFWEWLFAFLVHKRWTEALEEALQQIQQEPYWRGLLPPEQSWLFETPIAEIKSDYGGAWVDGGFDPAPLYAQLRCPVLCVWGEEDTVLPVTESIACIQQALQTSAHPEWATWTIPHANHLLYLNRAGVDEQTNEALHDQLRDIHLPEKLFERIVTWARDQLERSRRGA
jgi:pimeloyl-ACP methyl ester carboxylesterase